MTSQARGTFSVDLTPLSTKDDFLGRLTISKQFHGDLEATSEGEMLSAGTSVEGSAGYVALELVSGTLSGRTGAFVLQHSGILNRGRPSLSVTVVPDSGTAQLAGISGSFIIEIVGEQHSYRFDYSIPDV